MVGTEYRAPVLNREIVLRNPGEAPERPRDAYGRPTGPVPAWGAPLWAHRRDQAPRQSVEEGVLVDILRTTFTVRYRAGVAPDVEIVDGETVFSAIGPAIERGTRGGGASHLQIVCERRT